MTRKVDNIDANQLQHLLVMVFLKKNAFGVFQVLGDHGQDLSLRCGHTGDKAVRLQRLSEKEGEHELKEYKDGDAGKGDDTSGGGAASSNWKDSSLRK